MDEASESGNEDRTLSLENLTKQKTNSFVLSPKSLVLLAWETIVAVSVVLSILLITIQATYNANSLWQLVLVYLCDGIFVASIVIRFFTGYENKGALVSNHRQIAGRYLKTTLIPDIVSVIPLEVVCLSFDRYLLFYAALLRLNRLLRLYKPIVLLSKQTTIIPLYVELSIELCLNFSCTRRGAGE